MIDIFNISNGMASMINDNICVDVYRSNGYTIGTGAKQIPSYENKIKCEAQMQALDGNDLRQIDGMNLTGTIRALYIYGSLSGVVAPLAKGGDKVVINGKTWLIVKILEAWATWTKVVICLQQA